MAKTNVVQSFLRTHEGAPASNLKPIEQLRRSVMACMLFEDTFYEDGLSVADRIAAAAERVQRKPRSVHHRSRTAIIHS